MKKSIVQALPAIWTALKMLAGLAGVAGLATLTSCQAEIIDTRAVDAAIERQLADFPESRLQDLYKSFFQDRFGPGHIINDRDGALRYIEAEMAEAAAEAAAESAAEAAGVGAAETAAAKAMAEGAGTGAAAVVENGPISEPCGWEGNYVRVSLRCIQDGTVSAEELTDALMQSAIPVEENAIRAWEKEWKAILARVKMKYPDIPGLEEDSRKLDSLLASGQYAYHQSAAYEEAYHPHYRILKKDLAEKLLGSSAK